MTVDWSNWLPSNWAVDETLYWLVGGVVTGILIDWAAARLAVAESRLEQLSVMESEIQSKETEIGSLSERITDLVSQRTELSTRLEQERSASEEKVILLSQFQNCQSNVV